MTGSNAWSIAFAPQLPLWLVAIVIVAGGLLAVYGLARGTRGSWLRLAAWAALSLALFNPAIERQEREALKSVVAVVVDDSASQALDNRKEQTEAIRQAIVERIGRLEEFEVREIVSGDRISSTSDVSTALFGAMQTVLRDVPAEQVGGAIFITDGQVHDIPQTATGIGIDAPVHALITGHDEERDRRIVIESAPRFGVVGETVSILFRVIDTGLPAGAGADVSVLIDGEEQASEVVATGRPIRFELEVPHGGKTVLELRARPADGEITLANNRAFSILNGIRENLRVLLVSGEPHAGERTWRNLLKSDASVDLVHFTILRPPEKQDGTPINQLSLIAFPTRELFVQKIDEFDLIIFDRYRRRGVLPVLYFDNIARYVSDGGAVLIAAGPEYANQGSIAHTPLANVLPGEPDGNVAEVAFRARISDLGHRHPVTRGLDGAQAETPQWGRWFRAIGTQPVGGDMVLSGPDDMPLLMLNRAGEGRVALLLSDHAWLWARGFDGGGPHVQLLRRLAHWLMKEPELAEERLSAEGRGGKVVVTRQTLGDAAGEVVLTGPTGETQVIDLAEREDGLWRGEIEVPTIGLYRVDNGELTALTHVGPPNPREFAQVASTGALLEPALKAVGGSVRRAAGDAIPRIVPVRGAATAAGNGWIGLKNTQASALKGISRIPLFSGLLGLSLLLAAFAAMWAREGR